MRAPRWLARVEQRRLARGQGRRRQLPRVLPRHQQPSRRRVLRSRGARAAALHGPRVRRRACAHRKPSTDQGEPRCAG